MIDIPFEDALKKIEENSELSREEIEKRINDKLEELSGLISKDGAAHIVANDLGVKLVEQQKPGQEVKIGDLAPHSRGVTVKGRIVQKWEIKEFDKNGHKGRVANLLVGDDTGVIKVVFWNDQVDVFEELKEGDILVVRNPFVKQGWQDRLEMQLNDQSQIQVNPEGVTVPERQQAERPDRTQMYIKDLSGGEENAEIVATLVQIYDPRFYDACSECRRKLSAEGLCPEHGEVKKDVNFNIAAFLDDGTGNIRTSFWKKQALVLTGKSEEEFIKYRDSPEDFEELKTDLLGEIIKVVGSAKKNDQFDRIEFNVQLVFTDVDPAKELKNLERKLDKERNSEEESPEKEESGKEESESPQAPQSSSPGVKEEVISLDDLEEMGK